MWIYENMECHRRNFLQENGQLIDEMRIAEEELKTVFYKNPGDLFVCYAKLEHYYKLIKEIYQHGVS